MAVYDHERCIQIIMGREDAEDHFAHNVLGSSLSGGRMPVYVLVERNAGE